MIFRTYLEEEPDGLMPRRRQGRSFLDLGDMKEIAKSQTQWSSGAQVSESATMSRKR